jgi:hypothetical protein
MRRRGKKDPREDEDRRGGAKEDQEEKTPLSEHSAEGEAFDIVTLDNGRSAPTALGPETPVTDTGKTEEGFEEVRL